MKKGVSLLCAFAVILTVLSGCGATDSNVRITCADVITAYEDAGYEVWHRDYAESERDYLCEIAVQKNDGGSIHFHFYDSADEAKQEAEERQWNVLLWLYTLACFQPTWLHTGSYENIEIEYDDTELYKPFRELIQSHHSD